VPHDPSGSDDVISATTLLRLIQDIWNPLEVKVILAVAALGGMRNPVREVDLLTHASVQHGARGDGSGRDVLDRAWEALEVAIARGALLRLGDASGDFWLMLGTEENQRRARGNLVAAEGTPAPWTGSLTLERPSIFSMYEQNIGLVTPIIADRLIEAIDRYPETWVEDAIAEAVSYNRRSWRYIQRILENWSTEGRTDEADRGGVARDRRRTRQLDGKYAHLFGRDGLPDL
jgi:DnaD/phage-associated family protein